MKQTTPIALSGATLAAALAFAAPVLADKPAHAPDQSLQAVGEMLEQRGYHHIQVEPESSRPGHVAYGCKGAQHFRVYVDEGNNITDVEPTGACDPRGGPKKVHVQAPFTDVLVSEDGGVRVRAPFVDIRIR